MNDIDALRKKLIKSAKRQVQEKYEGREVHIIKAVNILEDLDSASNLLLEQLVEWYSAHFPELSRHLKDQALYARLVYTIGARNNFTEKNVQEILHDAEASKKISGEARNSMGSAATEQDMDSMKELALNCHNLKQEREYLASYLEANMKKELPNFAELAGAVIGAKILAKVGSKRKLAFLPGSAIQVVGAEKALFMHKKKGVKGPKYGYLFQHPLVKAAKATNKGRMARSLASKLAIAAKKDFFGNKSGAGEMRKELDERAKALKEHEPKTREKMAPMREERTPPARQERPPRKDRKFVSRGTMHKPLGNAGKSQKPVGKKRKR